MWISDVISVWLSLEYHCFQALDSTFAHFTSLHQRQATNMTNVYFTYPCIHGCGLQCPPPPSPFLRQLPCNVTAHVGMLPQWMTCVWVDLSDIWEVFLYWFQCKVRHAAESDAHSTPHYFKFFIKMSTHLLVKRQPLVNRVQARACTCAKHSCYQSRQEEHHLVHQRHRCREFGEGILIKEHTFRGVLVQWWLTDDNTRQRKVLGMLNML